MKEEFTDADDYVDWIQWAADEEQRKQSLSEATNAGEESVLLQIQQMEIANPSGCVKERITKNPKEDTRWGEICQKIRIDPHLEKGMERQLWSVLEQYQDHLEWFGTRRQLRGLTEHCKCCFGINHWRSSNPHHLFMIDVEATVDAEVETNPSIEVVETAKNEELEVAIGEQRPKGGQITYYNRRQ
ncbi:unnamed protein product [Sphagnum jensenii]|uniref:Uncharacterized protein n=1 Tax=Sphagnum jensenii TaxID=128206 RepID=A0ABP1AHC0_9BRYO